MISNSASHLPTALTLLLALLFQGCATSAETRTARLDHRIELATSQLQQKTDADSLAAAGLLCSAERKPEMALDLLVRASARAPERADLAWLLAVNSAHAALQFPRSFKPDVVLLDIGLPEMDGYEVASRLRKLAELNGVRLIALTGYGQCEDRERATAVGFDDHLVKPVEFQALERALAGRMQ
jgi:CheY-like chemotaxis protein